MIPPVGTSAYKAYLRNKSNGNTFDKLGQVMNGAGNVVQPSVDGNIHPEAAATTRGNSSYTPHEETVSGLTPTSGKPIVTGPKYRSSRSSGGSSARSALDYYEAPLAEYYGFGKETAYQEAMANTAYRREIADMRKAGLNPSVIYGDHNTSGAATDVYPRGGSGGSGGSGRRYGRGKSGNYLFSGGAYYGLMAAVGAATTLATHNVGAGMAASAMAGTAMKALNGFFKGR